ncbi:MAG: winged helix-turn-helix transcriptional regulator [Acidobacteriia bacterium]|nr:winged helix-turn-helix transcriptional regulator [Terriglobia bacterium]
MKLNRAIIALTLAFVLAFSFAALLQKQKEFDAASKTNALTLFTTQYSTLTFPSAINLAVPLAEKPPLPDNLTRNAILDFVSANPGVQFRAICSGLGLSVGVVQFHLAVLQKAGFVSYIRKGKFKRFFAAGKFTRKQMETIATLRLSTVKNILKALLEGKRLSHHELSARVSISSQGLTWQMSRLRETGLIQETKNGLNVAYTLENACVPLVTETIALLEKQ